MSTSKYLKRLDQGRREQLQAEHDSVGVKCVESRLAELSTIRGEHGDIDSAPKAARDRAKDLLGELAFFNHEVKSGYTPQPTPGAGEPGLKDAAVLTRGQSISGWANAKGKLAGEERGLRLGAYLKGLATGDWEGALPERKAMSESVLADGGHLVPTPLSASVIDLARNKARVFQGGASTVPMESSTLKIARQSDDPTAAWHAENTADITESELSFDSVTLSAKTLTALVKFSRELFEDVPQNGLEARVQSSIAEALALEIDRAALYGDNTANPKEPDGLRNTSGITVQTLGTDGEVPANYDFLLDAYFAMEQVNHEATGAIDNPRTERTLSGLTDTTNQPLRPPAAVERVPRLATNQVRTDQTVGTNTDCSDLFAGDWADLMIGMRTRLEIQFLRERFAETGTLAFLAWLRADVQVARTDAFVIVEGIRA